MDDVNVFTVGGRLGRDLEFRHGAQRTSYGVFSVCSTRYVGRDPESKQAKHAQTWFECQTDGRYAESIQDLMTQGRHVTITGEMRSFQTEEGKQKGLPPAMYVWVHKVVFTPLERRPDAAAPAATHAQREQAATAAPAVASSPTPRLTTQVGSGIDEEDDDYAFRR